MATNGQRPKLEPELNQEVRVKLLKDKPYSGENGFGKYYLYEVEEVGSGESKVFFAPDYIHTAIEELKLSKGSEFVLRKIPYQNGNKITSKLEISVISTARPVIEQASNGPDTLKDLMIQSMRDAADVVAAVPELGFRAEDARAIGLSMYISRSKQW